MKCYFITVMLLYITSFANAQKTGMSDSINAAMQRNIKEQLGKQQNKSALRLYPNPANTYTNIYVEWPEVKTFSIEIYDVQYKSTLLQIPVNSRKSYQYALDVTKLPDGYYKILLKSGEYTLEEMLRVLH